MPLPPQATPCPSSTPSDVTLDICPTILQNQLGYEEDDTAKIDFTRDFRLSRPVFKRQTTTRRLRRAGRPLDFTIHSDDGPENLRQQSAGSRLGAFPRGKLSVLSQPAQRPGLKAGFSSQGFDAASSDKANARRESGPIQHTASRDYGSQKQQHSPANYDKTLEKPARRGTIYIPPEDTTMPTMWMGAFGSDSGLDGLDGNQEADSAARLTGLAAQMAQKRGTRNSSVAAAPRRAPLQRARRPPQEKTIVEDVVGQPTGKENLPPGHLLVGEEKVKKFSPVREVPGQSRRVSRLLDVAPVKRPYRTSFPEGSLSVSQNLPGQERQPNLNGNLHPQTAEAMAQDHVSISHENLSRHEKRSGIGRNLKPEGSERAIPAPLSADRYDAFTESAAPARTQATVADHYPVLSEDIQSPSLYEDSWLHHQEIAITQLVNSLFDAASESSRKADLPFTRSQVSDMYQDRSMVLLQKRLQGSLLYGSLCAPKEALGKAARLGEDLAMKQRFLDLWLNTYDLSILQACAEVVIGRECSMHPRNPADGGLIRLPGSKREQRRILSEYLETFIIRNEDKSRGSQLEAMDMVGIQWTLLRSLMLVKLLDQVKTWSGRHFRQCLFLPSSRYKNSSSVIEAVVQQLLPCAGNALRSLGHLDYVVSHVQQPLEEYEYEVENVAIDFRDGVRLTRLVELLLYPAASGTRSAGCDADSTSTITMPTGDILPLVQGEPKRPLSQHLKLPCLGRATKIYNCQIALSALNGVDGVRKLVANIQAEHVVDGFREKTLALLWGLSSRWGLGGLIDSSDVTKEIRRMGGVVAEVDDEGPDDSLTRYKSLLRQWAASAIARKGLSVTNLSTSFADGRVFEAIVGEYEPFLSTFYGGKGSRWVEGRLSERLAALGCSQQFASLFSSGPSRPTSGGNKTSSNSSSGLAPMPPIAHGKIFDHDFTLASLAFLASRLLSASKPARAGLVIQVFWRRVMARRGERRRFAARRLAEECRVVVQTQERMKSAKGVIWEAWKQYRGRVGRAGQGRAGQGRAGQGTA